MRDIILIAVVLWFLPYCFLRPYTGLMMFSWMAYMRPNDLTWGFTRYVRFSQFIAIAMIAGWVLFDKRKFMVRDKRCVFMILMAAAVMISYTYTPDKNFGPNKKAFEFVKIIAIALFTTGQLDSKSRIRGLLFLIGLSFAFYGIKGGIAGVLFRNAEIIRGPGGLLLDNNDFALAMVMNLPILHYLALSEANKKLRLFLRGAFVLTIVTVVITGSRGGFLAMAAVCALMVWKSEYKLVGFAAGVIGSVLFLVFIPEDYKRRLSTLTTDTGEMDKSASGRIHAWGVAFNMAVSNPFFGVGFQNFVKSYDKYDTNPSGKEISRVAHNSYFQIWAESGSFALGFFLATILSTLLMTRRIQRAVRVRDGPSWIIHYSAMIEVTLWGYMVGATFLNRAHFDLMYQLVAIAVAVRIIGMADLRIAEREAKKGRKGGGSLVIRPRRPKLAGEF